MMNQNSKKQNQFNEFVEEKVIRHHSCEECNTKDNLAILYVEFSEVEKFDWVLSTIIKANEADVAEGDADYIGEVLCGTLLTIKFCPFCGEKLE